MLLVGVTMAWITGAARSLARGLRLKIGVLVLHTATSQNEYTLRKEAVRFSESLQPRLKLVVSRRVTLMIKMQHDVVYLGAGRL